MLPEKEIVLQYGLAVLVLDVRISLRRRQHYFQTYHLRVYLSTMQPLSQTLDEEICRAS